MASILQKYKDLYRQKAAQIASGQGINRIAQGLDRVRNAPAREFTPFTSTHPTARTIQDLTTGVVKRGTRGAVRFNPAYNAYRSVTGNPIRGREFLKSGADTARLGGSLLMTPLTTVTAAGIGGSLNKAFGGDFKQGIVQGIQASQQYGGLGRLTNPIVSNALGKLNVSAPVIQRGTGSVAGVIEGIGQDYAVGSKPNPMSIGMDALAGFAGYGNINTPNTKAFKVDKLTYDELINAEDMIKNPKAYIGKITTNKRTQKEAVKEIQRRGAEIVDRISAKYLPDKQLNTLKTVEAKIKALADLNSQNKLANVRVGIVGDTKPTQASKGVQNPVVNTKTGKTLNEAVDELRKYGWREKDITAYRNKVLGIKDTTPEIQPFKLDSDIVYHGTSADNIKSITKSGFKKGSELPEGSFRGGGYDQIQDSISFSTDPKMASRFTGTSPKGAVIEARLKPNTKVVTIKGIDYAEDLNPRVKELKKKGIDAVYLEGEKEVVVLDKNSVITTGNTQSFNVIDAKNTDFFPTQASKVNDLERGSFQLGPEKLNTILSKKQSQIPSKDIIADGGTIQQQKPQLQGAGKIQNQSVRRNLASSEIVSQPEIKREIESFTKKLDVKTKVNFVDYIRTPDRVLKKLGLGEEADLLKQKYREYNIDLPKQIGKITNWFEEVKNPESSKKIFQYLDGKKVELNPTELKVAGEMKAYLSEWADKLGLPEDKRVTNYITHLFDDELIQKEFSPELAKIIEQSGVPGSVYDPFLQKRYGVAGYKEDVFEALDAYTKRATRKFHMDQALGPLKKASKNLDLESEKYVKRLASRINLRPTEVDNLLDNLIKQSPVGYKFTARPVANLTRKVRQWVYRGTLGLNIGSATRNLTQGVNTYAKLGGKWTTRGYIDLARNGTEELKANGILSDTIIQDRTLSSHKKFWQSLDNRLWTFFDWAEKINRGSAYYGAKAKALSKGLSEEEAVKEGIKTVEDTQFTFGSVDTPLALQSDLVKFFTQFQSYNVKQAEFLAEMVKNKEVGGLVRWAGANLLLVATVGKLFGMRPEELIPFSDLVTEERSRFGQTPPIQLVKGVGRSIFGGEEGRQEGIEQVKKAIPAFIPAGVQIKKTYEGIKAYQEGASLTPTGRKRFDVEKTPSNLIRAATFGQYTLPGSREYFNNLGKSKSSIIADEFGKAKTKEEKAELWKQMVQDKRITKDNASDVTKALKDKQMEISKKEKSMRSLPVKDGSRARMINKEFNKAKTKEEKAELWKRYVELGIITKDVAKQLILLLK